MHKIVTCLWVNNEAEEAANYYAETFENCKITRTIKFPKSAESVSGKPAGSVMTVEFEIDGYPFMVLNGGKVPGFELTSGTSFIVNCEDQEEIDRLWAKLSAVPEAEQCGWCKDKFGVTWQIVPKVLDDMMADKDQDKVERVTKAFLPMKKLDIATLTQAYEGR